MPPPDAQVIDACVLINLLAGGEVEGILRAATRDSLVCSAVERESIYLRTEDPKTPVELIDLGPLIASGLFIPCRVEGAQESELYVDYAGVLDDGEAMSLAIALSRGYVLATDERKARRLFLESGADPRRLTSTSEMIRRWVASEAVPPERVKAVLLQVERRARYQPPADDVNRQWWVDVLR